MSENKNVETMEKSKENIETVEKTPQKPVKVPLAPLYYVGEWRGNKLTQTEVEAKGNLVRLTKTQKNPGDYPTHKSTCLCFLCKQGASKKFNKIKPKPAVVVEEEEEDEPTAEEIEYYADDTEYESAEEFEEDIEPEPVDTKHERMGLATVDTKHDVSEADDEEEEDKMGIFERAYSNTVQTVKNIGKKIVGDGKKAVRKHQKEIAISQTSESAASLRMKINMALDQRGARILKINPEIIKIRKDLDKMNKTQLRDMWYSVQTNINREACSGMSEKLIRVTNGVVGRALSCHQELEHNTADDMMLRSSVDELVSDNFILAFSPAVRVAVLYGMNVFPAYVEAQSKLAPGQQI
jgi:hypothetical protein